MAKSSCPYIRLIRLIRTWAKVALRTTTSVVTNTTCLVSKYFAKYSTKLSI